MSFKFSWPEFTTEFVEQAKQLLTTALNKSSKPVNIVDPIVVKDLNMGTKPPELEIMEICELAVDKFRGIFKLIYSGDAHLTLQTKVQANPMNSNKYDLSMYTRRGILAADQPLVVPMLLRLSNLKLRGIIVLVVSKQKGITLVFKNDPLEKVDVTSTFDSISSIQRFLQSEIEKRLRTMFQEDLPSIVHQLSLQKWLSSTKKKEEFPKGASEKMPITDHRPLNILPENTPYDTMSMPDLRYGTPLSTSSSELSSISPESSFYAEEGSSIGE
ncbi:4682_t:CDS:2, partial [Racocetra fulgida]